MLDIYGSVILDGKEFVDNQIHDLIHRDVTGWSFGLDRYGDEGTCLCVASKDLVIEEGFDTLEAALAFVNRLNEIPKEAQARFVNNQKRNHSVPDWVRR
jgi:hypothetical protein